MVTPRGRMRELGKRKIKLLDFSKTIYNAFSKARWYPYTPLLRRSDFRKGGPGTKSLPSLKGIEGCARDPRSTRIDGAAKNH